MLVVELISLLNILFQKKNEWTKWDWVYSSECTKTTLYSVQPHYTPSHSAFFNSCSSQLIHNIHYSPRTRKKESVFQNGIKMYNPYTSTVIFCNKHNFCPLKNKTGNVLSVFSDGPHVKNSLLNLQTLKNGLHQKI